MLPVFFFLTFSTAFAVPLHSGTGECPETGKFILVAGNDPLDGGQEDLDLEEDLEAGTVDDLPDSDSADDQWEPAVMGAGEEPLGGDEEAGL